MDTKTLRAMADRLQELADGGEPINRTVGICNEMGIIAASAGRKKIAELSAGWPEFSGDDEFPVPSFSSRQTPEDAFFFNSNVWTGEYGAARRRLCGFLAQEIRKELGDEAN